MRLVLWMRICALLYVCAGTVSGASAQNFETLINFDATDGATPVYPGLVQGFDGNLYGTTLGGGAYSNGTVFKITPQGKLTTLYSFCSQVNCPDGNLPQAGLVLANNGTFYGTTTQGGAYGEGTVFKITTKGVLTTLHSFDLTDGAQPFDPPVQARDGNFYGTTNTGGSNNAGTIFKMTPVGALTTLHSLVGTEGALPLGTLVQASNGALYGTTELGGTGSCQGTIFRITTGGNFATVHSFDCKEGAYPASGLIQATNGNLYGTAYTGGTNNTCGNGCGTVFKVSLKGSLTAVYNFDSTHGANPVAALVQGSDGNIYGTTYGGGSNGGWGTIFRLTPRGTLTTLHSFDLTDGAQPYGALVQATGGKFYGTAPNGGSDNDGTVFSLSAGLKPFVETLRASGKIGAVIKILGNDLTGTTSVSFNGTTAKFSVLSSTEIKTNVPAGATSGYVTVTSPNGTLKSNAPFHVLP